MGPALILNLSCSGVESITEEDCPNELKSGKAFFYVLIQPSLIAEYFCSHDVCDCKKYDRQGRPITYVFPRLHFPDKTDPEEGVLALLFYHEVGVFLLSLLLLRFIRHTLS